MNFSRFTYGLNSLALLAITAILGDAFVAQIALGELPCPLCLLQRAGFIAVGLGFLLNLRFGVQPLHYGLVLLGALVGSAASIRQVLLHIAPGDAGYSNTVLGFHLYTWSFFCFIAIMIGVGLLLCLTKPNESGRPIASRFTGIAMLLFLLIVAGNLVSTLLECGLTQCADDPTRYLWLDMLRGHSNTP